MNVHRRLSEKHDWHGRPTDGDDSWAYRNRDALGLRLDYKWSN